MIAEAMTAEWQGKSGSKYTYYVYPVGHPMKAEAGNYIFAKMVAGWWWPVYIGETDDLKDRTNLASHHKGDCIKNNGATYVHAHLSSSDAKIRRAEESDLLNNNSPACNG